MVTAPTVEAAAFVRKDLENAARSTAEHASKIAASTA